MGTEKDKSDKVILIHSKQEHFIEKNNLTMK